MTGFIYYKMTTLRVIAHSIYIFHKLLNFINHSDVQVNHFFFSVKLLNALRAFCFPALQSPFPQKHINWLYTLRAVIYMSDVCLAKLHAIFEDVE